MAEEKVSITVDVTSTSDSPGSLVTQFEITLIMPCNQTPGYIRFSAIANNRLDTVIPTIFLSYPSGVATFSRQGNILSLRLYERNISLFPSGEIGVSNTPDIDGAREIIQKIAKIINDAHAIYLRDGPPDEREIEAAKNLNWMEIYKNLPKLNCRKCGFQVCSAFAVSLLQGTVKMAACTPLLDLKYQKNLHSLEQSLGPRLMKTLGWSL